MTFLLLHFTLRHLRRDWLRTLMAVGGVALGVAVFLAIRIANASVLAAFASTVDAIAGKASLEITAPPPGLDEQYFPRIEQTAGVQAAAPQVQAVIPVAPPGLAARPPRPLPAQQRQVVPTPLGVNAPSVMILGIDPFRERPFLDASPTATTSSAGAGNPGSGVSFLTDPLAVLVSDHLAQQLHLQAGTVLPVVAGPRVLPLHVLGVWPSDPLSRAFGGKIVVMDIAGAQELLGKVGRLTQVEIRCPAADTDAVRQRLQALLPANARVERPSRRTETVERMLGAFELNLEALSLIALFVGTFLIYNTLSAAVVRRRGELGILRGLGVTRWQIMLLVAAEAAAIGVGGAAAGVALGCAIADGLLSTVAATVTALYVRVEAAQLHAPLSLLLECAAIGVLASLVAAVIPALEATRVEPAQVMRQRGQVRLARNVNRGFLAGAVALLLLALLLSKLTLASRIPILSFGAAFSILGGFSLLAPLVCLATSCVLDGAVRRTRGMELRTADAFFRASLERVWIVVGALGAAVAMLVGLGTMIGSFRVTVQRWVNTTIAGDLYVSPASIAVSGGEAALPPWAVRRVAGLPGIAAIDSYRSLEMPYHGREILLEAPTIAVLEHHGGFQIRQGNERDAMRLLQQGAWVMVSGVFADLNRVKPGDTIELPAPGAPAAVRVAAVFEDYSSDQGAVLMDRSLLIRRWQDSTINSLGVYVKPGVTGAEMAQRVEAALPGLALNCRTNDDLRREILRIFDQTFRVTYALEVVAVLVALLGIASTLTTLVLQRSQQLAMLRAVGASTRQVASAVVLEAGLIGFASWLLGSLSGLALAAELVYVVLPAFFHWTVELDVQPALLGWALVLMAPTSLVAALLPARAAGRVGISQALRVE